MSYPLDRVYREIALLGRHVPWTLDELLQLDHAERRRWLHEVTELAQTQGAGPG